MKYSMTGCPNFKADFALETYQLKLTGKNIKGSQKTYKWGLKVGERLFSIVAIHSVVTGRVRIIVDGREIKDTGRLATIASVFQFKFKIDDHIVTIQEGEEEFYLRIDSYSLRIVQRRIEEAMNSCKLQSVTDMRPKARKLDDDDIPTFSSKEPVSIALKKESKVEKRHSMEKEDLENLKKLQLQKLKMEREAEEVTRKMKEEEEQARQKEKQRLEALRRQKEEEEQRKMMQIEEAKKEARRMELLRAQMAQMQKKKEEELSNDEDGMRGSLIKKEDGQNKADPSLDFSKFRLSKPEKVQNRKEDEIELIPGDNENQKSRISVHKSEVMDCTLQVSQFVDLDDIFGGSEDPKERTNGVGKPERCSNNGDIPDLMIDLTDNSFPLKDETNSQRLFNPPQGTKQPANQKNSLLLSSKANNEAQITKPQAQASLLEQALLDLEADETDNSENVPPSFNSRPFGFGSAPQNGSPNGTKAPLNSAFPVNCLSVQQAEPVNNSIINPFDDFDLIGGPQPTTQNQMIPVMPQAQVRPEALKVEQFKADVDFFDFLN